MDDRYNVDELTDKILVCLKDGRVKPVVDILPEDLTIYVYERWDYGGVMDPIGQLSAWLISKINEGFNYFKNAILSGVWSYISGLGSSLSSTIQSVYAKIVDYIGSAISSVVDGIKTLSSSIANAISSIVSKIGELYSLIQQAVSSISTAIGNIANAIQTQIGNVVSTISNAFTTVRESISNLISNITTTIRDITNVIQTQIGNIASTISNAISNAFTTVREALSNIPKTIEGIFDNIRNVFDSLQKTLASLASAFQGFANPLVSIYTFFETKFREIGQWIWGGIITAKETIYNVVIKPIENAIKGGIETIKSVLEPFFKPITDFFGNIFENVKDFFTSSVVMPPKFIIVGLSSLYIALKGGVDWFVNEAIPSVSKLMSSMFASIAWLGVEITRAFASPMQSMIEYMIKTLIPKEVATTVVISNKIATDLKNASEYISTSSLKNVFAGVIALLFAWLMSSEFSRAFMSVFDSVRGGLSVIIGKVGMKISLKRFIDSIFSACRLILRESAKTFIFTTSFWIYEPMKYLLNPHLRNWIPIEIPTLHEIVELTRRYLPSGEIFRASDLGYKSMTAPFAILLTPLTREHYDSLRFPSLKADSNITKYAFQQLTDVLSKRGYPIWFEEAVVAGYSGMNLILQDRFNVGRMIPTALLYDIPPPSDCVRMMLRDIIQDFEAFGKLMLLHGYHPDVSAMYYLLHFRYPSTERLFEFACRIASGVAWVGKGEPGTDEYFRYLEKEISSFSKWGLGFAPKTPKELAETIEKSYPLTDLSKVSEIATARIAKAFSPMGVYFKWHDLFPMAWINGWTSDQMIQMELSADIPMRIDARWMYKWSIIDEREVVRIVMARGMHPKWVEKIALGEMMNALAEERTFVRTGIINSFKEGFLKESSLWQKLTIIETVKLLGREVPIRFLEGETKLLVTRAKYDRALDILLALQKTLFTAYSENLIDKEFMIRVLNNATNNVASKLGIILEFDQDYYDTFITSLEVRKEYENVSRVRRWLRYAINNLFNRINKGYLSEAEIEKTIDEIAKYAKFADLDTNYFKFVAKFMLSEFERQIVVEATLKKLSKGEISKDDAIEILVNAGIKRNIAEAMVEIKAKTYSISVAQYLSYSDYLEIPIEYLERKLDLLGVPKDEKEIILQVFKIKPINDERSKLVTRYLDEFENGYVDETTVRDNLRKLGLRSDSIEFLIASKKVEKSMNAKKLYVDAILNRLKRGVMKLDEAINELKKYIVDENLIYALIEKNIRTYTFSPDKLISMSEYVPIDMNWLIEKAKLYGYPEEEIKLFPAYMVAREISEEMKRLANELGQAFAEGLMTEEEYKKALDELATLGGQAKSKFGVDWIVLSPEERYVLVQVYKTRAVRKLYSQQQISS